MLSLGCAHKLAIVRCNPVLTRGVETRLVTASTFKRASSSNIQVSSLNSRDQCRNFSRDVKRNMSSSGSRPTEKEVLTEETAEVFEAIFESSSEDVLEANSSSSSTIEERPGGYRGLALASVAAAVGLFMATRGAGAGPDLSYLSSQSVPYDLAMTNGKPSVVEFYADWCEVCREMVKDVYSVEQSYRDKVNFVMINIDNGKWAAELDEFGVDGIPHFAFLDSKGNEEGNVVGKLPRKILEANVDALANGKTEVPYARVVGAFSSSNSRKAPPVIEPRSHGHV